MNATLGFCFGNTLHAVNTAFIFQFTIDLLAANPDNDLFEPAHISLGKGHDLRLPSIFLRILDVHGEKAFTKQCGLIAPGPSSDFQKNILIVVWIFWKNQYTKLFL